MLNAVWLGMIIISIVAGIFNGKLDLVVVAITDSAKLGFELGLGLIGIMALWLGIMNIASESGLIRSFAGLISPVSRRLFPEVPEDHPAMGAMVLNMTANMLGLANAATPFGLQAMKELQKLNKNSNEASDAMCTFLAINTSSIQLIPATSIAFLALNHCSNPTSIILSSLLATTCSTVAALIAVKYFAKLGKFHTQRGVQLNA